MAEALARTLAVEREKTDAKEVMRRKMKTA